MPPFRNEAPAGEHDVIGGASCDDREELRWSCVVRGLEFLLRGREPRIEAALWWRYATSTTDIQCQALDSQSAESIDVPACSCSRTTSQRHQMITNLESKTNLGSLFDCSVG